ncbi:uncharacterized protein LOC109542095 [Dendroctonus ponderosae]
MWKSLLVVCLLPGLITGLGPLKKLSDRYFIIAEDVTFIQAMTFCAYYAMEVPSITTAAKNLEIMELFENSTEPYNWFWIAGTYQNTASRSGWTWLTSKEDFAYTNWRASEPTISDEGDTCVRWGHFSSPSLSDGLWSSSPCAGKFADILCQVL